MQGLSDEQRMLSNRVSFCNRNTIRNHRVFVIVERIERLGLYKCLYHTILHIVGI